MKWDIEISNPARKEIKRIHKKDAKRLLFVLEELKGNPYLGDIKKVKGEENVWRRRVGNYRIVYEVIINRKTIEIHHVVRKTTTTYR